MIIVLLVRCYTRFSYTRRAIRSYITCVCIYIYDTYTIICEINPKSAWAVGATDDPECGRGSISTGGNGDGNSKNRE